MNYGSALNHYNLEKARREISDDPSRGFMDKIRNLSNLQVAADQPLPQKRKFTLGNLFHGLIGAGVGLGLAKGLSHRYNLNPGYSKALGYAGAGIGAAINSGILKTSGDDMDDLPSAEELERAIPKVAEQRRNAFRLGFIKGAADSGYFGKTATAIVPIPTIPLSPSAILSIPKGVAKAVTGGGEVAGATLGTLSSPDPDEEEIARMQVEKELLEERLERLRADKRNRLLRQLLAKRQSK